MDFGRSDHEEMEVVLDLVVLACSEDVDFHRGDHEQVCSRRTWRSHYRSTCLLDMWINCGISQRNCLRNLQTRGGGRGPRNSGFRGGRSTTSGRSGVRFVGLSTVWDESGQTFYVTD